MIPDTLSPEVAAAERALETAMIALRGATDSRGRMVRLPTGAPTSKSLLRALQNLPRTDGAATFARHKRLLNDAYAAALEFERVSPK